MTVSNASLKFKHQNTQASRSVKTDKPAQKRAAEPLWPRSPIDPAHLREASYIATIVERQTRFTILVKVDGKKTDLVVHALARQMTALPIRLKQSLTWDRGTELASHQKFTVATDINVYFCDPSSPWQRGTNENTNGSLRQYFPKGSCLSKYSQEKLDSVANHLNNRPRKTLGFLTPARKLEQVLQ